MNSIVLGIDVGLATTGWSIVKKDLARKNKLHLIDFGIITTKPSQAMGSRLGEIYDSLIELIEKYGPDVMAVESLFFFKNKKTIITVGQARGAILLAAHNKGLATFDYTPLEVKTAVTGYGKADKLQVQKMVQLIFGLSDLPKPDDAADAIAVATCHINTF